MATQVQQRRGTTAQHNVFTGANGELTVDTSKDTLVIHDGTTQGGFPLARESDIPTGALASLNSVGASQIDADAITDAKVADNALSGDKIDGGTISNFTSTGIDDNATSTKLTVADTGVNSATTLAVGATPPSDVHTSWKNVFIGTKGNIISSSAAGGAYGLHTTDNAYYKASTGSVTYLTTDQASMHTQDAGTHKFFVAPSGTADTAISWTTALTIENNGNVAIDSFSTTGASDGVTIKPGASRIVSSSNTAAFSYHNRFYNTNGQVGYISTDTSATYFVTSSDYRLKENVVPMSGSIDRLKALNPSRFNFITSPLTTVDGFIAHEAQVVVPESVHGIKDAMKDEEYEVTPAVMDGETVVTEAVMGTRSVPDYQGIDQSKLVPLLVASLQEAVAKIESLEARVTALEV